LGKSEVQVVAVCDVDSERRRRAKALVDKKYGSTDCLECTDFREIIRRKDIDAVMIATPDHWHAIPVIEAAKAGKDIHCQKPLALTIHQGRAMSDACRRHGVVFQTGSQQRSDRNFRFACELVRNGRIGKLLTMEVGLPTGHVGKTAAPEPPPAGFDYDFWLGPAPWAPYCKGRTHWDFRWILDYSGGQVTDWGAHHCDIAQWGNGTSHTGPVEIEGKGVFPRDGLWNAAVTYRFECTYADGARMIVADGTTFPNGIKFVGTDGWVFVSRGKIDAQPKSLLTSVIGPSEIHLYESGDHKGNFLECVRARGETVAPIENAHRSVTIAHLGNIAMLLGRKVRWNPDAEQFVDDPEADRFLSRAMRAPWHL
ncbi:MAG: Gfo/Idh/MocA family oxidoreductase, partial [Planctomycetes bacterium]|nr:Gfo/Idh/MocA family oxidoreductase [Planctomycetota bacterium]